MTQNHWYIGCASAQLKDQPLASQIYDKNICIFRDSNGLAHAVLDRCCHRGFPLSQGPIVGDHIQCGFHGWEFNGQGDCKKIPSQNSNKAIPKSHRVQNFLCKEKDGYIWIWIGEEMPKALPSLPEFHSGKWIQGSCIINANYIRVIEISFDAAHIYFAHPKHHDHIQASKNGYKIVPGELRRTPEGCIVFYAPTENESDPIPEKVTRRELILPNRVRFEFHQPEFCYHMYIHAVPLENNKTRLEYMVTTPEITAPDFQWITEEDSWTVREDKRLLELSQLAYNKEGDTFERSVDSDIPCLTVREILRRSEAGTWDVEKALLPKRRIFQNMAPNP